MKDKDHATEVKALRKAAGLKQREAAALVGVSVRTWQSWEDDGPSGRGAPANVIELFKIKVALAPETRNARNLWRLYT